MHLINHADVRNKLISGLHAYTGLLVVQQSSIGTQPAYTFITYSVTSPYLPLGHPEEELTETEDVYTEKSKEHYEQVYSFTVASEDEDTAMDWCMKAIQYFKFYGVQELADQFIAIVKVTNVSARDNMITIDYERRYGFDVRIRVASEESRITTDVIETVTF